MEPLKKNKLTRFDKNKSSPTVRQRKAAYKAWKTIRANKRTSVEVDNQKIDRILSLGQIATVVHPEIDGNQVDSEATSFGRGIVSFS